jgi:hypothetical protein
MDGDQDWLTMRQAAARLRVTPITIRRRLRRGELDGRLTDTPSGQAWLVRLPDGDPPQPELRMAPVPPALSTHVDSDPPQERGQLDSMVALVDKLQQQNLELAGRVGYYQAEVEHLRTTLKALEAPWGEPTPRGSARHRCTR